MTRASAATPVATSRALSFHCPVGSLRARGMEKVALPFSVSRFCARYHTVFPSGRCAAK